MFDTSVVHPLGLALASSMHVQAYNRSGAAAVSGDVFQFDMNQSQTEVSSITLGAADSIFANVIDPVATLAGWPIGAGSFYCIATEAIADNAEGRFMVRGVMEAYVIAASGSVAVGDPLVVAVSNNLDLVQTAAAGEPCHAIALEAESSPSTRALCKVMFDGIYNFGVTT